MKINNYFIMLFLALSLLTSCSSDDDVVENIDNPEVNSHFEDGILVLNEGSFGHNNSSVSFINADSDEVESSIYSNINERDLGDTGQSLTLKDDKAYFVMNVSNTVEIVNRYTMESLGTIDEGLLNPRYLTFLDGKIYVTNWGVGSDKEDDYVAVFNAETLAPITHISVGEGPEKILSNNGKLYVALKQGYGQNNKITVINTATNIVEKVIEVGYIPTSLEIEDGILWVLSSGIPDYVKEFQETAGSITKIDLTTNEIVSQLNFANTTDHPKFFQLENNIAYYTLNGALYSFEETATELPTEASFQLEGVTSLYAFEIENDLVYTGDAPTFSENGIIRIYSLEGNLVTELSSGGIGPNGFYFND